MIPRKAMARLRLPAAFAFVIVLVGLVAHNVSLASRNDVELPEHLRPRVKPRDIQLMAAEDHKPLIFGRLAHFYFLKQRVSGAHIRLPPTWRDFAWEFEHVARMRVSVGETAQIIDPKKLRKLRRRFKSHVTWDGGVLPSGKHRWHWLRLHLDKKAKEFVLAESLDGRELFILPERVWKAYGLPAWKIPPERKAQEQTP